MPHKCVVANCTNTSSNQKGFPFFCFPRDKQIRQQWVEAVKINESDIKKSTKVCFKHFEPTDYHTFSTTHKLKKGKVPTLHLHSTAPAKRASKAGVRSGRVRRKQKRRKRYRKSSINLSCRQSPFLVKNFKTNNAKINYYTGLQSFAILRALFKFVHQKNWKTDNLCRRKHRLTPINELFLTLMRLRRGFEFETLSEIFFISTTTAFRIFMTWINLLYTKLASLHIWPHRDVLLRNAPTEFLEKFPGVLGSIDCIELSIEKVSSLSQCYSHYKGVTTLKGLIMVDPNGAIVFVSDLFPSSISDKRIVEESRFCNELRKKLELGEVQHGDIILADKGLFKVTDAMEAIGIKLNIPKSRITGLQCAAEDVEYIRTTAHERVHVERAIRRLKAFSILSKRIPSALLDNINKIYNVCAFLTNFKDPLQK